MPGNYGTYLRAPKVDVHAFSMIPRADIPRSSFKMEHQHKTTFEASYAIPVYLQEVLPGDSFSVSMSAFCRLSTPIFPILDNMDLESFFFFVPNRLIWNHWPFFQGEQNNPADSIVYTIPQIVSPVGGFVVNTLPDYFGLPCVGQVAGGNTVSVNALPFRAYNLIMQEWFRDQNLSNARGFGSGGVLNAGQRVICVADDGPDSINTYVTFPVAKRHDYFTSCLPWTQKSTTPISIPLGTQAVVRTNASDLVTGAQSTLRFLTTAGAGTTGTVATSTPVGQFGYTATTPTTSGAFTAIYPSNLYADLTTASAATINALRLAFQTQRLLERDARGGTRYTEIIRSHWGVLSPDARLMRPEYLGGGKSPVVIAPVPQTSSTGLTGGSTPIGQLAAAGMVTGTHGFRGSFTEHGYIIGIVCVRNDKVYQQGIRRLWSRSTRYDFFMPVFSNIGEMAVLNKEIYADGSANDALVFGYQEAWADYRFHPSLTTAFFNSTHATPLDAWHLAQKFTSLPALNGNFIVDDLFTTIQRTLAAGASAAKQNFLADFFFRENVARAMPMYSVPGMIDHF